MKTPQCFKCGEKIRCAITNPREEDYWEMPQGVCFQECGNFGSAVRDRMFADTYYELVLCDGCVREYAALFRELKQVNPHA